MTPEQFLMEQAALPPVTVRRPVSLASVLALEARMKASGCAIELPVTHRFSPGIYARELRIPAGTILIGKTHRFENLNILSQGDISVLVDGEMKRVQAPFMVISPPGTKRAAYAHTDCTWTTLLATPLTDVAAIEAEFLEPCLELGIGHCLLEGVD